MAVDAQRWIRARPCCWGGEPRAPEAFLHWEGGLDNNTPPPVREDNLTNDEDSDGDGGGEVQLKRAGRAKAKAKAEAARVAEWEEEEKKSGGGEGGAGG